MTSYLINLSKATPLRVLGLLFLSFYCTCVCAQIDNFQRAELTLLDGSTLSGWVNGDGLLAIAKRARFRPEKNDRSSERSYSPSELREVRFTETERRFRPINYQWVPVDKEEEREELRLAELLYSGSYDLLKTDRAYYILADS